MGGLIENQSSGAEAAVGGANVDAPAGWQEPRTRVGRRAERKNRGASG